MALGSRYANPETRRRLIVYGTEAGECLRANLPLVVETLPCPIERSVVFGRNVWQSGDTRGMM
jgi:hypothetical protein